MTENESKRRVTRRWAGERACAMAEKVEAAGYSLWHVRYTGSPWEVRNGDGTVAEAFVTLDAVRDWVRGPKRDG